MRLRVRRQPEPGVRWKWTCHVPRMSAWLWACLDPKYFPKFHYAKRRFFITSKCRHMYGVLNVDEIKN
jgi:hypothetical protein